MAPAYVVAIEGIEKEPARCTQYKILAAIAFAGIGIGLAAIISFYQRCLYASILWSSILKNVSKTNLLNSSLKSLSSLHKVILCALVVNNTSFVVTINNHGDS